MAETGQSPETWAQKIQEAIGQAEAAGLEVWISNDCCGCTRMGLRVALREDVDGEGVPVEWAGPAALDPPGFSGSVNPFEGKETHDGTS